MRTAPIREPRRPIVAGDLICFVVGSKGSAGVENLVKRVCEADYLLTGEAYLKSFENYKKNLQRSWWYQNRASLPLLEERAFCTAHMRILRQGFPPSILRTPQWDAHFYPFAFTDAACEVVRNFLHPPSIACLKWHRLAYTSQWNLAKFQIQICIDVPVLLYSIWELLSNILFACTFEYNEFLPVSSAFFQFFPLSSGRNWKKYLFSSFFHSSRKKPVSSGSFRTLPCWSSLEVGLLGCLVWIMMKMMAAELRKFLPQMSNDN